VYGHLNALGPTARDIRFCLISPNPNSPNVNKIVTDVFNVS